MYDVLIIGAGISGTSIARYLSRFKGKFAVVEKADDVCCGTTKANSAIVHAGYDAKPGSLMARFNVEGNAMMDQVSQEMDVPFSRIGSLVVCTEEEGRSQLEDLLERGKANGVEGLRIVERAELEKMEPNISDEAICALYAPSAGIICPFELNLAMAENAYANGVEFIFNSPVISIEPIEGGYLVQAGKQQLTTKAIVNAAGVYADDIHNLVCEDKMTIIPRKGEYYLLDKMDGQYVHHTIFQLPTKMGKGVLVTPTIHGNLLVGPTATDIDSKEGLETTASGLGQVAKTANIAVKNVPLFDVITSFAGLRAHHPDHEFIIRQAQDNFFDVAGIESPGLSAGPAIGQYVSEQVAKQLNLAVNEDFNPRRPGQTHMQQLSLKERNEKISQDPAYGRIVCRCEMVSEGEILEAIHRPLGAKDLDGLKRRVRTGMGRCQGGFCSPRLIEILEKEQLKATKKGEGSSMVVEA